MDKETFEKLVKTPAEISSEDAVSLEELAEAFPYCQTAHLLLAKESHLKKSMHFPKKLQRASTYTLDRKVLHKVLHPINYAPAIKRTLSVLVPSTKVSLQPSAIEEPTIPVKPNPILSELEENLKLLKQNKQLYSFKEFKEKTPFKPSTSTTSPSSGSKSSFLKDLNYRTESKLGDEFIQSSEASSAIDVLLDYIKVFNSNSQTESTNNSQQEVINKFISREPSITKRSGLIAENTEAKDLSKGSTELKLELITENYAQILVKQNKIEKAKEVYQKLILKYPEKSSYFASKIIELENHQ